MDFRTDCGWTEPSFRCKHAHNQAPADTNRRAYHVHMFRKVSRKVSLKGPFVAKETRFCLCL